MATAASPQSGISIQEHEASKKPSLYQRFSLKRLSHEIGHIFFDRFVTPVIMDSVPLRYKKEKHIMCTAYLLFFFTVCTIMAVFYAAVKRMTLSEYMIDTMSFAYNGLHPYPRVCINVGNNTQAELTTRSIYNQYNGGENITYYDMVPTYLKSSESSTPVSALCAPEFSQDVGMQGTLSDWHIHIHSFHAQVYMVQNSLIHTEADNKYTSLKSRNETSRQYEHDLGFFRERST